MESYNLFLYRKRKALGLGMRAFARKLHIGLFRYHLIENGYIKPSRKDISVISSVLETDYAPFTEGLASYPEEKPETGEKFRKLYDFYGSRVFRCVMVLFCLASLFFLVASRIDYSAVRNDPSRYFSEDCRALYNALAENGETSLSVYDSFYRPCVYRAEEDKYISLKGDYDPDKTGTFSFRTVYWTEEYRCSLTPLYMKENDIYFSVQMTEIASGKNLLYSYTRTEGVTSFWEVPEAYGRVIKEYADSFFADYDGLIREKLSLDLSAEKIFTEAVTVKDRVSETERNAEILYFITIVTGLLSLFGLIYSFVYGTRNGKGRDFSRRLPDPRRGTREPRTDIRFFPFIPETVFEIIGIILLAFASLRFQIYLVVAFMPGAGLAVDEIRNMYDFFMMIFYAGMFLLYFIDFDLFMDDRRVIRNFFAYLLVFVGLYLTEQIFLRMLNDESLLFSVIGTKLPNMFGSISMYFLIMYLLYFTPKFINTRKKLILFRSLSAVPVILLFGTYVIFNGANTSFGWNLPNWALYLFASERIPFSLLCVSYLFGVYFLRLFFIRRYGEEAARRLFNGNRFLFLKNGMACLIIMILAVADQFIADIPGARSWGFGYMFFALFLVPLVLFYHPRKGPRNRIVDYVILVLYFLAFTGVLAFLFTRL